MVLILSVMNLIFTDHSFSQAAPTVWNNLPQHVISDLSNPMSLKLLLKSEDIIKEEIEQLLQRLAVVIMAHSGDVEFISTY